jgi:hypothetical protein
MFADQDARFIEGVHLVIAGMGTGMATGIVASQAHDDAVD